MRPDSTRFHDRDSISGAMNSVIHDSLFAHICVARNSHEILMGHNGCVFNNSPERSL